MQWRRKSLNLLVFRLRYTVTEWRHDTQHNDTQHNDTQHNDTQHNYILRNDT